MGWIYLPTCDIKNIFYILEKMPSVWRALFQNTGCTEIGESLNFSKFNVL